MIRTALLTLCACIAMVQGKITDGVLVPVGLSLSTEKGHKGEVKFAGSNYVKVHITELKLGEGDMLVVQDEDGAEVQEFTEADMEEEYGIWALTVLGEKAMIEVRQTAANAAQKKVASVTVSEAFHGVRDYNYQHRRAQVLGQYDIPDGCQKTSEEIACERGNHQSQFNRANAVARLNLGGGVCTAWRAGSKSDTMITNNHCIGSQGDARQSQVEFDYQDSSCNRGDARSRRVVVAVAEMLYTNRDLDLTVFRVRNPSKIAKFGSFELDRNSPRSGDGIYIAGHPAGRPKELAQCRVEWVNSQERNMVGFDCSPEGGSSGSPVISRSSNKAVGLLCHGYGRHCGGFGARSDLIYEKVINLIGEGGSNGNGGNGGNNGGSQPTPRPPRSTPTPWWQNTPNPPTYNTPEPDLWWCEPSHQACGDCYESEYWANWARSQCGGGSAPTPKPPTYGGGDGDGNHGGNGDGNHGGDGDGHHGGDGNGGHNGDGNGGNGGWGGWNGWNGGNNNNNNCRHTISAWGNCHKSPKCCERGLTCHRLNQWYSQCL